MTSDQMVSVSLIWQFGHMGKGADVFAKPPHCHGQKLCSVKGVFKFFFKLNTANRGRLAAGPSVKEP